MTTLTDVEQDYDPSPRVSVVLAPRTQFVAQDVVDTLRKLEDSWRGMSEPKLLDAAGKEDLGGFNVGITYALQDNQVQFEDRQTPAETGTVTTASVAAIGGKIEVIDAAADFVSASVERGSFIVNWDDQSIVSIDSVVDLNTLSVKVPTSGIGNNYGISDAYSVFNVERVFLDGGNATAVDTVPASISPVVPSVGTYVFLTLSSSATSIESLAASAIVAQIDDIHGQVQRSIFINTEALTNGSGYQQSPYNNLTDAVDDAEANGITSLVLLADVTLDRQLKNFSFMGVGDPTIDLAGFDVDKSEFRDLHLTGDGNVASEIHCHNVELNGGLNTIQGDFFNCGIAGTVGLTAGGNSTLVDCYSTVGGLTQPILDVNGGGCNVSVRSYRGGLQVAGVDNAADEVTVSMAQGRITLSATNTDGVISLRGTAQLTDNSAGSVVDKSALIEPNKLLTIAKFLGLK